MTVIDIERPTSLPHERAWNDLTAQQQATIDDLLDTLGSYYDAPSATEQLGLSRLIAATAGITLTTGQNAAQCDPDFGCSAILDGHHASGIQVSSSHLITLCSDCTTTVAPQYDA